MSVLSIVIPAIVTVLIAIIGIITTVVTTSAERQRVRKEVRADAMNSIDDRINSVVKTLREQVDWQSKQLADLRDRTDHLEEQLRETGTTLDVAIDTLDDLVTWADKGAIPPRPIIPLVLSVKMGGKT